MRALTAIASMMLFAFLAGCGDDGSSGGAEVDAVLDVTPGEGTVITGFTFDAGASTGGNHDLEFRWDWEGDGTWDTCPAGQFLGRRFDSNGFWVCLE